MLQEISSETVRRLEEKAQTLSIAVAPDVGAILADRDLVRRIVENLIDNAYKYSPRDATITIESAAACHGRRRAEARPSSCASVTTGMGIPAAYRTRIFEKYVRIEQRTLAEPRNSHGLGLVFCRRAVEVHGGEIWVEENSPKGSCFCVRLPRLPAGPSGRWPDALGDKAASPLVAVASAG